MALAQLKDEINSLLEKTLANENVELADLVLSQYKSSTTLRIFIYSQNGNSLEECARISRVIGDLIDGTDYFEKGYTLEVSTPGLDRPLTSLKDFKYRKGENVKVEFKDKKRKKITAEIVDVTDCEVIFKDSSDQFNVAIDDIEKGKIIF